MSTRSFVMGAVIGASALWCFGAVMIEVVRRAENSNFAYRVTRQEMPDLRGDKRDNGLVQVELDGRRCYVDMRRPEGGVTRTLLLCMDK